MEANSKDPLASCRTSCSSIASTGTGPATSVVVSSTTVTATS